LELVYQKLKAIENIDVFKRNDVPKNLNYKNNVRVGDLVIITHVGYSVYINTTEIDWDLNRIKIILQIINFH
jgi:hypothetical protein